MKALKLIGRCAVGIGILFIIALYFQTGLDLTTAGTPIRWMHGPVQFLVWMGVPAVVLFVLFMDEP